MKRPALLRASLAGCALALLSPFAPPAVAQAPVVDLQRLDHGLRARALGAGAFVIEGANADFSPANGCNIINTGFLVGRTGVLVINTGPGRRYGEQQRALIERSTGKPVRLVLHLNLHPDYFLGNQAYADVPRRATEASRAGMAREAAAYESNLYRLCGDWMKGTEALLPEAGHAGGPDPSPDHILAAGGRFEWDGRRLLLWQGEGHTDSDLVLVDRDSGVAFVGGLAFADRIPTTPHARLPAWHRSLTALGALLREAGVRSVVPSHGPVRQDLSALAQTRDYLAWLDQRLSAAAAAGEEMAELIRQPLPAPYRDWAAADSELLRNVVHLYPRYEQAALRAARPRQP